MPRYRASNVYPPIQDGDFAFTGYASRRQSTVLPKGIAELSINMRMDRTTVRPRKGLLPAQNDLVLTNPPVVFDFDLGSEWSVTSITRSGTTATVTTSSAHGYTNGDEIEIRGAVETEYNGLFTITVTGTSTFTCTVSGSPSTPATGTIYAASGPTLFTEYADAVQCSCLFATNDTTRTEYVIICTTTTAYAIRPGAASQAIAFPSGETIDPDIEASMKYYNGSVYLFRGYQTAAPLALTGITQTAGTATATTASAHGYSANDWVYIEDASTLGYDGIVQVASVPTATTFTYTCNSGLTSPAVLSDRAHVRACQRPLVWDGDLDNDFVPVTTGALSTTTGTLIHLPPVPWGEDYLNRLVVPWKADEILISDPFDADSLDIQYNQFRLRYGSYDRIEATIPTPGQVLFVLCRRSLQALVITSAFAISASYEISRDLGCASRRTIGSHGGTYLWLGDRGVHRVKLTEEYNLVPQPLPLSDDVQDTLEAFDWTQVENATAIVWNNRYYLWLPDTGVLVFNFLNDRWETLDSYPSGFDVENWHILNYEGEKRLFATTTAGALALMEESDDVDSWGSGETPQEYTIAAQLHTRYYTGGTMESKRCRRMVIHASLSAGDSFTAQVVSQNPDFTGGEVTITASASEDGRYPIYAGIPGSGAQMRINTTAGRPDIRAIECEFAGLRDQNYNQQT